MKYIIAFSFVCLLFLQSTKAQEKLIILNTVPYKTDRYKNIKGSPYLFKDWQKVNIYSAGDMKFENIEGNYNGETFEFEVLYKEKYTELPYQVYPKIEYTTESGESKFLKAGLHPKFKSRYIIVHAESDTFAVLEDFQSLITKKRFETPGKTLDMNRFKKRSNHYILKNGELISFKPKEKDIIKQFGYKKEVKAFVKKNKLKVKKISDAAILLAYMNKQGWIK